MDKLKVVVMQWDSEVEGQEIELIERGVPPWEAHQIAVNIITNRRRKEYADKSGG